MEVTGSGLRRNSGRQESVLNVDGSRYRRPSGATESSNRRVEDSEDAHKRRSLGLIGACPILKGSFVQSKAHQRWLWHAIDHLPGVVLAYAFGKRADKVCVQLQKLLRPFGLVHFYPDAAGVYERHLPVAA